MNKKEFSRIRRRLRKTQSQMAQVLGVSGKAIQSFEQGWRNIPAHIERQALFLLARETSHKRGDAPCWTIVDCPAVTKENCPAWEFQTGELCWFINGTICHGEVQKSWGHKMRMCRQCRVFRTILSSL